MSETELTQLDELLKIFEVAYDDSLTSVEKYCLRETQATVGQWLTWKRHCEKGNRLSYKQP